MTFDDELEEFRAWRNKRLELSPLEESFEALERIINNPFLRGYDSAFRVMARALVALRDEVKKAN
jgi:hypothetical protein